MRLSRSAEETGAEAGRLAGLAKAGLRLTLSGPLGAGKTEFVRGLARGLGYTGEVSSPTYVFFHEYPTGRGLLIHADLYRLADPQEIWRLGLEEYLAAPWLAIEWGERLAGLGDHLAVTIEFAGPFRRITGRAHGTQYRGVLASWQTP